MHFPRSLRWLPVVWITFTLVLSACQAAPTAIPTISIPVAPVVTERSAGPTLPPTWTPTPTAVVLTSTPVPPSATPAPPRPFVTPQQGMTLYTHNLIPDAVFQVDPNEWMLDPYRYGDLNMHFLRNRNLANCLVLPPRPAGTVESKTPITVNIGSRTWSLYNIEGQPIQSARSDPYSLALAGYSNEECQQAIDAVLTRMVYEQDARSNLHYQRYQPPYARPALADFSCSTAPVPYLRVGDQVQLVSNSLWLRSEPNKNDASRIVRLTPDGGWQIEITGGPQCGDGVVYWQAKVSHPNFDDQTGWLGEATDWEPYLEAVAGTVGQ